MRNNLGGVSCQQLEQMAQALDQENHKNDHRAQVLKSPDVIEQEIKKSEDDQMAARVQVRAANCSSMVKRPLEMPLASNPAYEQLACGDCAEYGIDRINLEKSTLDIFKTDVARANSNIFKYYNFINVFKKCTIYTFISPTVKYQKPANNRKSKSPPLRTPR